MVHQQVNFNFESTFVKQYFGSDHSHELSYEEFVQLLQVYETCKTICIPYDQEPKELIKRAYYINS